VIFLSEYLFFANFNDIFLFKGAKHELLRLHKVFNFIPSSVGDKLKFSQIDPLEKSIHMLTAVDLLN
jgi:hypothetical protein